MYKSALISQCGKYRYHLQRVWDKELPRVCYIMLNPSTADAEKDDATIRRCIGFAKSWGYGGIDVVNLYAYRATQPSELWKVVDPVGPDNDIWLRRMCAKLEVSLVVAAWGCNAKSERVRQVFILLPFAIHQIGQYAFPRHPLRLPGTLTTVLIRGACGNPCEANP